jgi:hypothetical protein
LSHPEPDPIKGPLFGIPERGLAALTVGSGVSDCTIHGDAFVVSPRDLS